MIVSRRPDNHRFLLDRTNILNPLQYPQCKARQHTLGLAEPPTLLSKPGQARVWWGGEQNRVRRTGFDLIARMERLHLDVQGHAMGKAESLFQQQCRAEQLGIPMRPPYELESNR